MAVIYTSPLFHADDDSGAPLVGGKVYTYLNGTTTPATTYQDAAGATPNTNPITLNARGEAQIFLASGTSYTFLVKDSLGAEKYTVNDVTGPLGASALADYAPLSSPAFVDVPTAPTPTPGNSSTQLATTAFVGNAISTAVAGVNGVVSDCLITLSGSDVKLLRNDGLYLTINGAIHAIPAVGVTLSASGAASSTLYYIYAAMSGATMTLEKSTTSYTVSTVDGTLVKNGDESRALVGMARTDGSGNWQLVRSYFNDPGVIAKGAFTADRSTNSTAGFAEINSEIQVKFLAWAGEQVNAVVQGGCGINIGVGDAGYGYISIAFDGTTAEDASVAVGPAVPTDPVGGNWTPLAVTLNKSGLSEGYHYATVVGKLVITSGSGFVLYANGSATTGERTTLTISTLTKH